MLGVVFGVPVLLLHGESELNWVFRDLGRELEVPLPPKPRRLAGTHRPLSSSFTWCIYIYIYIYIYI